MSEDRFKQARRSLIDRHNQRQQQGDGGGDWDDFEDEATAMVNLDGHPQFAPPPNFAGDDEDEFDEHTEMISLDQAFNSRPPSSGVQMRTHSGVQPSYDAFGGQRPGFGNQPGSVGSQQSFSPQAPQPNSFGSPQGYSPPPTEPGHDIAHANPNQSLVIGDSGGYDGNTAFVNLNDFAAGAETFTPDSTAAGYEGNTQFVNITALQAGAAAGGQMPVEQDPVLHEGYQFGPESVQHGETTLIFAQNQAGRPVVLKRIWEGDPNGMPMPLRQRVAALDQIRHPRLIGLNGMVASQTGAWVELSRPAGYRLTDILQQNGPQPKEAALEWARQAADILGLVHQQGFVYANLTTDALWIQDDGTVILEPFDILEFEHRGNLGVFGPPEMNFPPEQRQLYPATDVYSLAAVIVAAMAGLPLNLGAVQSMDKKLSAALTKALQQNPQERPQTVSDFVDLLGKRRGGKGAKGGGKKGLDMKFLLVAVAVLGTAGLGTMFYLKQQRQAAAAAAAAQQQEQGGTNGAATAQNAAVVAGTTGTAGTNGAAPTAAATAVAAVGAFEEDPRLKVKTSLRFNPVPEASTEAAPDPDNSQAKAKRVEAREALDGIDRLTDRGKRDRYSNALQAMAKAIRLSGGASPEDEKFLAELLQNKEAAEIQKEYYEKIDKGLRESNVSRVKSIYPQLAAIDADSDEVDFFIKVKTVGIRDLSGPKPDSSEED